MLVAIDGTQESIHALKESFKLATDDKSWINVVCVTPPYVGDLEMISGEIEEAVKKPCLDAIASAEAMAKKENFYIKAVHVEGEFHEKILSVSQEYNCELVVMGRKSRKRIERTLVGSTTARVIGFSKCDVLVVPSMAEIGWQQILVATDGSKHGDFAVGRAIDFASSFGGKLKVISVVDVPGEFYGENRAIVDDLVQKAQVVVDAAVKRAEAEGVTTEGVVREGTASEVILETAEQDKANTIVMASHGRTGLARLLMGSVTEQVIGFSECPVLVTKADD